MPPFPANPHRLDPLANFKFQISIEGVPGPVAGLSKMSALKRSTEVIDWREAGATSVTTKLPGPTKFEAVTFEKGLTLDTTFLDWANMVNNPDGDGAMSLKNYRKSVVISVLNLQGAPAIVFILSRAWPSEFTALPELDANAKAVAIQSLKLEHEGFAMVPGNEPVET